MVAATIDKNGITVKSQDALSAFDSEIKKYNPAFDITASIALHQARFKPAAPAATAAPKAASLN